jgi:hypothetical protein
MRRPQPLQAVSSVRNTRCACSCTRSVCAARRRQRCRDLQHTQQQQHTSNSAACHLAFYACRLPVAQRTKMQIHNPLNIAVCPQRSSSCHATQSVSNDKEITPKDIKCTANTPLRNHAVSAQQQHNHTCTPLLLALPAHLTTWPCRRLCCSPLST